MKKTIYTLLLFSIILFTSKVEAQTYPSVPKGITLEGKASGIGYITNLKYDSSRNAFIINDHLLLPNPVTAKEFSYLLDAISKDPLLGISVIAGSKAIYYGAWSSKGAGHSISTKLYAADEFFRGVVFGIPSLYRIYRLPGGYKPEKPYNREYYSAVWFNLRNFKYILKGNEYHYRGCNIQVKLLAVEDINDVQAPDGGYKFDPNGATHQEDQNNVAHIKAHAKAYLSLPVTRPMVEYGKAAALIRLFLAEGLDLQKLQSELD